LWLIRIKTNCGWIAKAIDQRPPSCTGQRMVCGCETRQSLVRPEAGRYRTSTEERERMPQMGLKDKVAIVTGAGSRDDGNGRAAAILLAREGAKVALLDAMKEWAEATKAMIDAEGGTSMVAAADAADPVSGPPAPAPTRSRHRQSETVA
jgi:hypothetical protein